MPSGNRNETFGRLLTGAINSIASYESKRTATIEEELGEELGVSGKTIQRYKSGYVPPDINGVKTLATAAVRRAFLGREWLQRFLYVAQYPLADALLNELCPAPLTRSRPPRVYENLPAPTYGHFVMREQVFTEVAEGLGQRSAAVLIVGMGGNGKTSLAREAAACCLREDTLMPRFDAVVWVSDKDHAGTTNLSTVLDEIARTLDYPGFTQFDHDDKRREVEQLLRRQRVLLVVDNYETITDGALQAWLLRLPEPSKALITTREYNRAWRSSWPVELRGMREDEARALVGQRLRALRIEHLAGDESEMEPLMAVTGGNPKAIELALGLVKYERRSLQMVVDDLHAARGKLFEDLFDRVWGVLDEASRRVLCAATIFPGSVNPAALSATADIRGFAFDRAGEQLTDLALLDVQYTSLSSEPRYVLHPLVRAYAAARLANTPDAEHGMRERWLAWYIDLTATVGWCSSDLARLDRLDGEQDSIVTAAQWATETGKHQETETLIDGSLYYFHVRGLWSTALMLNRMRRTAAAALNNQVLLIQVLTYDGQLLSLQNNLEAAEQVVQELLVLLATTDVPLDVKVDAVHAQALLLMAKEQYADALHVLQALQADAAAMSEKDTVRTTRFLATCLRNLGRNEEAFNLLQIALDQALRIPIPRDIVAARIQLARIAISRRQLDVAHDQLTACVPLIQRYVERRHAPDLHRLFAELHWLRGDHKEARASLDEAVNLYERIGMRRKIREAQAMYAHITGERNKQVRGEP